jgi:hypothetical protein
MCASVADASLNGMPGRRSLRGFRRVEFLAPLDVENLPIFDCGFLRSRPERVLDQYAEGSAKVRRDAAAIIPGGSPLLEVMRFGQLLHPFVYHACVTPEDAKPLIYWNLWFLKRLRAAWWAMQGSNLRPLPCEGSALH